MIYKKNGNRETLLSSVLSKREFSQFIHHLEWIERIFNNRVNSLINEIVDKNIQFLLKNMMKLDFYKLNTEGKLTYLFDCRYSGFGVLKSKNQFKWSFKDVTVRYNRLKEKSFLECHSPWISDCIADYGSPDTSPSDLLTYTILGLTSKILTEKLLDTSLERKEKCFNFANDWVESIEEQQEKIFYETS